MRIAQNIAQNFAIYAQKANIPRLGFAISTTGDFLHVLNILNNTICNQTMNADKKIGLTCNEISKLICNIFTMIIYELLTIPLKRGLNKIPDIPTASLKPMTEIIGLILSCIINDLIMPFFKVKIAAKLSNSEFIKNMIKTD